MLPLLFFVMGFGEQGLLQPIALLKFFLVLAPLVDFGGDHFVGIGLPAFLHLIVVGHA